MLEEERSLGNFPDIVPLDPGSAVKSEPEFTDYGIMFL
jgi:hypothetical protein